VGLRPACATAEEWKIPSDPSSGGTVLGGHTGKKRMVGFLEAQGYPHRTAPHERTGGWAQLQAPMFPSAQEGIQKGMHGGTARVGSTVGMCSTSAKANWCLSTTQASCSTTGTTSDNPFVSLTARFQKATQRVPPPQIFTVRPFACTACAL
jgi:hypothetical protein